MLTSSRGKIHKKDFGDQICAEGAKIRPETATLVIILWNFTMFQCRSDQTQVKWNVIFSIASLVYELPHKLPKDLSLRILGNKEILGRQLVGDVTQCPVSLPNFGNSSQKTQKQISNYSCPIQFYSISLFCSKCFVQD